MNNKILIIGIVTIALILGSCVKKTCKNIELFTDIEWYYGNDLVFRNDSAISYSQYDTINKRFFNDSAFALHITDSSLIYTRYKEQGYYDDDRNYIITHCEKSTDTVMYDLTYINKKPKLILYLEPFPLILSTKSNLTLAETKNFKPVKFVISDYSIGDQIDRSLLKTRGIYNYPTYTIEDCEFTENKDITFKIIGYNTIYSIERRKIEDYRIEEIKKVVTSKLEIEPEYRPMKQWLNNTDYEYEFYRWAIHGVQVNLTHSKYIGAEVYKTLVDSDSWTLTYDDVYLQSILIETYKNGRPQSSIIN